MDDTLTKVHVDLPNHWATGGESLWARPIGYERFAIQNVPFYAYDLNFGDIVEARAAAPDLKPSVLRVIERSGHRTIRVFFQDGVTEDERLRNLESLNELHVSFERCSERYFVLDLAPEANIDAVRDRLDEFAERGVLEYETCEARVEGSFDDVSSDE